MTLEELSLRIEEIKRNLETHRHTGLDSLALEAQTVNVSSATGTLPIANGGTGQTTATTALNALLPSQTGNSGKYLKSNGTDADWASGFPVSFVDQGNQSTSVTFDVGTNNKHKVTLTGGPVTLAVSNEVAGEVILLAIIQDATGSRTVTWFSGISWPGGTTPTLTTTASKTDIFGFLCTATDTFYGFILGQNL